MNAPDEMNLSSIILAGLLSQVGDIPVGQEIAVFVAWGSGETAKLTAHATYISEIDMSIDAIINGWAKLFQCVLLG